MARRRILFALFSLAPRVPARAWDACIFDLDGVLADSMPQHAAAYAQVLAPLGVEVRRADVFLREGQNSRHIIRDLLAAHGMPVSDAEARALGERKQAAFRAMGTPPRMRGAEQAIGDVARAGLRMAIVTGSKRENVGLILGPLVERFDAVVADGDYAEPKPSPEPYLAAARALAVAPTRCVVVENAPLGIRAAVAAGMACVAIPTTVGVEALRDAGAHAIAASLQDAVALVVRGEGLKRP